MIQFMPANHLKTNRVVTIWIHSDKTRFQNIFVALLHRVAKDVTSSLLSRNKRYDFNAANFRRHSQWKCALHVIDFYFCIETAQVSCQNRFFLNIFFYWYIFVIINYPSTTSRTQFEISLRALWVILVNNVSIIANSAFINFVMIFV